MPQPQRDGLKENSASQTPLAGAGVDVVLRDDAILASSGAYVNADWVISVIHARRLNIDIAYDPAASTGRPGIIVLCSNAADIPGLTDDSWYSLPATDGIVTATTLGGAVPSGADYTAAPDWGAVLSDKLLLLPRAAANAADEIRQRFIINVESCRYILLAFGEHGDTANPGNLTVTYSVSA